MIIKQKSKNGVVTMAAKTFGELNADETKQLALSLAVGDDVENYKNFIVHYNKKGELTRVSTEEFTDEVSETIARKSKEPNLLDAMKYKFGDRKQKRQARKKIERHNQI